ncbi:response regulator transcription factor [Aquipuribacter sp. SD81]|uniref:response regulator transcription factor n=1 Tax=Aquipuribacter sp. SD81 TaxID=3127703 RepID=UPI0030173ABB
MSPLDEDRTVVVAAVDDHVPVRRGLAAMLDDAPGITVAATADSVTALLAATDGLTGVDVVLLDLHLDDGSRPAANVAVLVAAGADVLVYSSLTDPGLLREALVAGALGVVHKGQDADVLVAAVRDAAAGQPLLTTEWAATLDAARGSGRPALSERETEALSLYASGLPMKSAARRMDISLGSFREYLLRVRRKYADVDRPATTKLDLYHRAVEDGYVATPRHGGGGAGAAG